MKKIKREEWISLADRKPEDDLICLVTDGSDVIVARVDRSLYEDGRIWWDPIAINGPEWELDIEPTHWMALNVELPTTAPD
jgi:hypothetical protein